MEEKLGRINLLKDTMLFVINEIFKNNIEKTITKENILKLLPEIYEKADSETIIKMLPYESYTKLEEIIEYVKKNNITNQNINEIVYNGKLGTNELEDAMIVVLRTSKTSHEYFINPKVLNVLEKIYTEDYRKLAKKYDKLEKIIFGMLYTYGIVEKEFYKRKICEYMKEIIPEKNIIDFCEKRLTLNNFVGYRNVIWQNNQKNSFVTYLKDREDERMYDEIPDLEDVLDIAADQKSRNLEYKEFKEKEILLNSEDELNEFDKEFLKYLNSKRNRITEIEFDELKKSVQVGDQIGELLLGIVELENDKDAGMFLNEYMNWYNNTRQYVLCGYSPNELAEKYYK